MSEISHKMLDTIKDTEQPRATFNLAVEYAAQRMKEQFEKDKERGKYALDTASGLETWLCEDGLSAVRASISSFGTEVHGRIIEGQIEDRGREVVSEDGTEVRKRIRQDAELAVRNEAAYRLHNRGFFPVSTGWSERYEP